MKESLCSIKQVILYRVPYVTAAPITIDDKDESANQFRHPISFLSCNFARLDVRTVLDKEFGSTCPKLQFIGLQLCSLDKPPPNFKSRNASLPLCLSHAKCIFRCVRQFYAQIQIPFRDPTCVFTHRILSQAQIKCIRVSNR